MHYFWSLGGSFLTSVGLLGAPREPSEHHLEEVANTNRLFTKSPGAHCGALLALAGQLVAPSALLFELLFVTLGRYWGPLGPKLQKDSKIEEMGAGREPFLGHLSADGH